MFPLLSLAAVNLWRRNRRRSLLSILAVASATVVFCAVMVLPYVTERIAKEADASPRLVVTNRNAMRYGLPESYAEKIEKLPNVVAVNRMVWFAGLYNDPHRQFSTVAIDVDNPDVIWPEYGFDSTTIAGLKKYRNGAVVGTALMQRFGWKIGQQVALRSQLYPVELSFIIVGTYGGGPDPTVFMFRRDYLEEALHNRGRVDMIWASVERIITKLDKMPINEIALGLQKAMSDLDLTLVSARGTLDNASTIVGPNSPQGQQLDSTLEEVRRAARSVRVLADYLDRHPEALIRGKKGEAK